MTVKISLPQGGIIDPKRIEIEFPSTWQVDICRCPADTMEPLQRDALEKAFQNPIGTGKISELAAGRREVCIVFDDITRGTKVGELLPFILQELARAGIADGQIRFLCAGGCHGAHTLTDYTRKLGADIVSRFPVYCHNPYENCRFVGRTGRGTSILLNEELLRCDFKIAVGAITPHPLVEFGGGAKIITPGVSSVDTIKAYHELALQALKKSIQADGPQDAFQALRDEMKEIARLAGLDLIVNLLVNSRCDAVDLVVGDPVQAYAAGLEKARRYYLAEPLPGADIVVANANFKVNEAFIAVRFGAPSLKPGGDMVIIAHAPAGQAIHYLLGRFGSGMGGRMWNPDRRVLVGSRVGRIVLFNPYRHRVDEDWFGGFNRPIWAGSWEEVMDIIGPGRDAGTRVNVFTDATLQYYRGDFR
jgi:lactate racemase